MNNLNSIMKQLFSNNIITNEIFNRINGLSYGEDCNVPLEDLRYLVVPFFNFDNECEIGEIICNRLIANDLIYIFKILFEAKYQIERIRLIDEYGADDNLSMINNNSTSCNYRKIVGSNKLSKHAHGLAIDINPLYNPYVRGDVVLPAEGRLYVDRNKPFLHKIDKNDLCYKLFVSRGFTWGGDWTDRKDYQHFEK